MVLLITETKIVGGTIMQNLGEVFEKLIPGLREIFGNVLESIILYGSVAKGIQTDESDVDIALLVREYTDEMHDSMIDFIVDLELEYGNVLSVLLIDYDNFREWENVLPFYKNVKEEGIVLWNAA
jgi:predicted nucleotidyltransferase